MAGIPGFEPGNAGIKNRCLTAWRYPNIRTRICVTRELMAGAHGCEPGKADVEKRRLTARKKDGGYDGNRTCDPSIMSAVL